MCIARIQRQRKNAFWSPLEAVATAVGCFDDGIAATIQDVHHLFVEVLLRVGITPWWNFQHVHVDEIAATAGQRIGAVDGAHTWPGLHVHLEEVHAEAFDDGDAFGVDEIEVGIDEIPWAGTLSVGTPLGKRRHLNCVTASTSAGLPSFTWPMARRNAA